MEECGQAETGLLRATHATPIPSVLKTESNDDLCLLSMSTWLYGLGEGKGEAWDHAV